MDVSRIKLLAFDLDGTITQHRSPMEAEPRSILDELSKGYKLIMVGAGGCMRIGEQMGGYPIDIIGNYGMEISCYDTVRREQVIMERFTVVPDRASVESRAAELRRRFGYTHYRGSPVEFHPSGMITFPLLGTDAAIEDKLLFDPTREKRRSIYHEVTAAFPEYTVFVGGTSSYDMAPAPYNKFYAMDSYCRKNGLNHDEVAYFGDDYEAGGGDHQLYSSDIPFICVEDYRDFKVCAAPFLDKILP